MFILAVQWTCVLFLDRQDLHSFISTYARFIQYAFYAASSLPGIIIFIFYMLGHCDARKAWTNCCLRCLCMKRKKIAMKEVQNGEPASPITGRTYKYETTDSSCPLQDEENITETATLPLETRMRSNHKPEVRCENGKGRMPVWLNRQYSPLDTDCPDSPRTYQGTYPGTSQKRHYGKMMTSDI